MRRVPAAMIVAALLFAGCNGGDDTDAADDAQPPVRIGMINAETGGRASIANLRRGTEAAIRYFNAERGGLKGHRIELRSCTTAGSPETSAACAHQLVADHVLAVRGGVDAGSGAALPILKAAGIAYIGGLPLLPPDFTTDTAFTFTPGGVGNAVMASYAAKQLKAKRVAILQADDPFGKNLAEAFVKPALIHGGVASGNITTHSERVTAADLAGVVQAAAQTHPDAIIVVFPPPACPRVMQAAAQLQVRVPMFYVEPCADAEVLRAAGAGAEGAYFYTTRLNVDANRSDKDVQLYRAKIAKYGAGVDASSVDTQQGFAATVTMLNRLANLEGSLTPAAVIASFKSAVDAPNFMSHPFTCDGKQALPTFVSVCSGYVRLYQYRHAQFRDVLGDWASAAAPLRT